MVEQCCVDISGASPIDPTTFETLITCNGVSGILDGTCSGGTGDLHPKCETMGAQCLSTEEVCDTLTDTLPIGPESVAVCADTFNCCEVGPGGELGTNVVGDVPWTCGSLLGFEKGYMGDLQNRNPLSTRSGYYCGAQDDCKFLAIFCGGDPHFKTWAGEWFDFHGECDLQLIQDKEFGKGLGVDIQVRTKARYEYSFIESAAIMIGDDVLEVGSFGQYFFNGVENADLKHAQMGGVMDITVESSEDAKSHMFTIYTGEKASSGEEEMIMIKSFKDLVSVTVQNAFGRSFGSTTGIMGDFNGKRLARDGKTIIEDDIEFGMEWQVAANAPELFQVATDRSQKCVMPSKSASAERRRLGENISQEAAEAACAAVDHVHHENCVYDVMATGDLESAHAGVF
jgi:hypothetical protein